jgi:hypothetical protein
VFFFAVCSSNSSFLLYFGLKLNELYILLEARFDVVVFPLIFPATCSAYRIADTLTDSIDSSAEFVFCLRTISDRWRTNRPKSTNF